MSDDDRIRWDARYAARGTLTDPVGPGAAFAAHAERFPTAGAALDVACGQGGAAVWLALRGLRVLGFDISGVAITAAAELAGRRGVADRCRFEVVDLDRGLPPGPPVELIHCHRFRDARLDRAMVERLAPGGLLAIAALRRTGDAAGAAQPFRVAPGELAAAFADLDLVAEGADADQAWLLARRRGGRGPAG